MFPTIKTKGYFPRPLNPSANYGKLKVFTSTHSHYSIDKAAQALGLGLENVIKVPVDGMGRMRVDELGKWSDWFFSLLTYKLYRETCARKYRKRWNPIFY